MVVDNAKKLNCDRFVTPADIINVWKKDRGVGCRRGWEEEKRGRQEEREEEARRIKADTLQGNDKLNLAFVADLFNKHSGLELPTLEEMEKLKKQNTSMSKILDEAEAR
jgi:hypothetical protein